MPTTGDTWINLTTGQILDFGALQTDLIERTIEGLAELRADLFGDDCTIGPDLVTFTCTGAEFELDAAAVGVTPDGYRLAIDPLDAAWNTIPFLDVGATVYYLGARRAQKPAAVSGNTIDGSFAYTLLEEDVGQIMDADSVADQGGGAGLVLTIGSAMPGGGFTAGQRPVVVWLTTPVTAGSSAIYEGIVEYIGGALKIEIPHYMGQTEDDFSTTPADYQVLVRGPVIKSTTMAGDSQTWALGTLISEVHYTTFQLQVLPWTSWSSLFLVEHDDAGEHGQITADGVDLRGGTAGAQLVKVVTPFDLYRSAGTAETSAGAAQAWAWGRAGASNPYYARTAGTWATAYTTIDVPADLPLGQAFEVTAMSMVTWMNGPSAGTIYLNVQLIERDGLDVGVNNGTVLGSWDLLNPNTTTYERLTSADGAPNWSGTALPLAIAASAAGTARYWRFNLYETNVAQIRLGQLHVSLEATRIEPW